MELHFRQWLDEATRWKREGWKRPPQDALLRLRKYNRQGYYCHFSDMKDKIGINPQSQFLDYTPFGIYAYTVKYALEKKIVHLPYAEDKDYIWVFRARNPKKIKKIKDRRDANGQLYLSGATYTVAAMAKYFLNRNIEGFVDEGTGTIHPSEPYQCVFFGSQTVVPLDVFPNTTGREAWDKMAHQTPSAPEKVDDPYGAFAKMIGLDDDDWEDNYDPYDDPEFQTAYGKSPWE